MTTLEHVDRDAVTVANVNERFGLMLKRFRTIEYYAKAIDNAMKGKAELFVPVDNSDTAVAMEFDPQPAMIFGMNLIPLIRIRWTKLRSAISTKPQKVIWKGYVKSLIDTFQRRVVLFRGISTLKAHGQGSKEGYKKTTMRRNRRQPERLSCLVPLRQHKANVWFGSRYEWWYY